jgi:hypothetical protein
MVWWDAVSRDINIQTNMGVEQSKCKCLYLPAQSGKTRKMEELIQTYKLGELFEPVDINIIISANNRVLVEQTKTRMTKDLATESEEGANDACIQGNVFSWTSGTKESNISPDALAFRLLDGQIEMVVICAHATRLRYLADTIKSLASSRTFAKRINIWIDEADNSINLWSKYQTILAMRCINQVTLVSATFDAVVSKYKDLHVLPYLKTHPDCYRGLKRSTRREVNFVVGSAPGYVRHVITTYGEELTKPGMRAFIPGSNSTGSHDAIAEFLHKECGFVVIIINGQRKEILVPDQQEAIDLRCYFTIQDDQIPQEFNAQLAKLYKENNWSRYPLAITGYLCVQRGVTFQCAPEEGVHDGFLFDYGIIPPNKCAPEAYQTMARLFGNVGDIHGYKPVEIFTNFATFSGIEKQEDIAINIARMVAEQGLEVVTKKDLKAAQNFDVESLFEPLHTGEFQTLADATKFMRGLGAQGKTEKSLEQNEGGFFLSSTTGKKGVLSYSAVMKEMTAWSKTSNFDVKKEEPSKKPSGRLYICYKDTADASSVVYIPRVLVPIAKK